MKLTVLGGGGFRAPILAKSLGLGAESCGIDRIVLMDCDETRLAVYGAIAKKLLAILAPSLLVECSSDARTAVKGADYIITTIRPGAEEGRAFDERCCLDCGVLGQETTGAGGYAMAMRSIPAIASYCQLAAELAPGAVILNFTNPSGLVTQAMHNLGYRNVFGVCDAPTTLFHQLDDMLNVPRGSVFARSYGLNHLSWFDRFTLNGADITQRILSHPDLYRKTDARLFGADLIAQCGNVLPNEYLHFWYFQKQSLANIQTAAKTRGEEIAQISAEMLAELRTMNIETDFDAAFARYMHYVAKRENSYFAIETGSIQREFSPPSVQEFINRPDGGGYAGVALDFIRARQSGQEKQMVLSVPNRGAIPCLADDDVVELSCRIQRDGYSTEPVLDITADKANLLRTVKQYENLAVRAILEHKPELAVHALTVHPLVADYGAAKELITRFSERYH